jgi:hypothetical protein
MKLKAIVTQEFTGRPDHESLPRTIAVGEEITGELAQVATANNWAKEAAPASASPRKPRTARKAAAKKPAGKR